MDLEITEVQDMYAAVKKAVSGPGSIVTVDGVEGAGQQEIALKLKSLLGAELIEVDEQVEAGILKAQLKKKLAAGPVVITGILVRKAVLDAKAQPAASVYVIPAHSGSRRAFWEGILSLPLEVYLRQLRAERDKATVRYHHMFHPIINADFLVEGANDR